MLAYPHKRFSSEIALTPKIVREYALAVGDTNPVHHDPDFAATTGYGRLIAGGAHTAALLFALTTSHFSFKGSVVGLGFEIRHRRPIFCR